MIGQQTGVVEVLHAAVAAFQAREVNFRDILEDLPAAIYTTDTRGRVTYFNRACIELSGRTPTLGDDMWCVTWKLFTGDGQPLAHSECPMAIALREGRAVRGIEAIAERPDGSRVHFLPYPTPIHDAAGNLIGAVNMLVDISERKAAEQRIALMAQEIDHRSKNLLAVMQAVMRLTKAGSIEEYRTALEGRFHSLAVVNGLLADSRWEHVDLRTLVEQELWAFAGAISVDGPSLDIEPAAAQAMALIIHELATNALKHGGLSAPGGSLRVNWSADGERNLRWRWAEAGGPPVSAPTATSTGTAVIRNAVRQLDGDLATDWAPEGFSCVLRCKLAA
jgi:PAS domain S-box-containing protein